MTADGAVKPGNGDFRQASTMALDKSKIDALKIDPSDRVRRGGRAVMWIALVAVLLAGAGAWFFWPAEAASVMVTEVVASPGNGVRDDTVLNASGYVVARRLATVSSKITGKILKVLVEEGLAVREGDVLAELDGATAEAQLALAQSQLESARTGFAEIEVRLAEARRNLERQQSLRAQNLVSGAAIDAAESEVKALRARLAASRSNVGVAERQVGLAEQGVLDLVIRAPFDGVVITKNAQPGEMISPVSSGGFTRTGICTIVDMGSREIEVDVNESYINRVFQAQPVMARLDAYPDWEISAQVINIVPTADRQKATVKVRISFAELDPRILPDMGVKVAFLETDTTADEEPEYPILALVKTGAVVRAGDKRYVWVVKDGVLERRAVRLAQRRGDRFEVIAGLRPGERIVSTPTTELTAGQKIETES